MAVLAEGHPGLGMLQGESVTDVYPHLLRYVLEHGERVSPRGRPTLEVSPFVFQLHDPLQSLVLQRERRLNRAYATVEKLALVAGIEDPAMLCFYIDRLNEFVNPTTGAFDGCYGPRVAAQLSYVYTLLRSDPDSRRAVIAIYSQRDEHESLDVPCTLTLQFLLRRGKLSLIVNMRSSDVYLGLPYDVNQFCFLQQVMASWLGVGLGQYTHVAGSAHVYFSDSDAIHRVLEAPSQCFDAPSDPDFAIPFNETQDALTEFFELERTFRQSGSRSHNVQRLHKCLQPPAECLSKFCRRKLASELG